MTQLKDPGAKVADLNLSKQNATGARRVACRSCGENLSRTFVDLGTSPLCQKHVTPQMFDHAEAIYPLHVYVCEKCWLVQLPSYVAADEIFDDQYAYFSSFSESWLAHAKNYVAMITDRLKLDSSSRVIELASNDGYLLQYFVQNNIPCLGVDPTANTAEAAKQKGVETLVAFWGKVTADKVSKSFGKADLILGNNVLAHVPDINDFVGGMKLALAPTGTITMEFPHLLQLMKHNQFDTIYHEHYSYLSLAAVEILFARHGLSIVDVDELGTHGGSIRIYAQHTNKAAPTSANVERLRKAEKDFGMFDPKSYTAFAERVKETKRRLLEFLIEAKRAGKKVVGYGAPGKGNTLLNYCGVRTDFVDYTVDRSPHKQGNFLPGTRIPILHPDQILQDRPDYVVILPWNLKDEIAKQMKEIRSWGGKFVVPIPTVEVF